MCSLEGEHVKLAVLAALFILIYLVGVPSFYCYILFRVLPKHGRGSTLGQAFGSCMVVSIRKFIGGS